MNYFENKIDKLSDGYHTFDELYYHRMALTARLTHFIPAHRSRKHHDGTMFAYSFIVVFYVDHIQCSYHYNLKYWDLFDHIETREFADEWDGHTPEDVTKILLKKDTL